MGKFWITISYVTVTITILVLIVAAILAINLYLKLGGINYILSGILLVFLIPCFLICLKKVK